MKLLALPLKEAREPKLTIVGKAIEVQLWRPLDFLRASCAWKLLSCWSLSCQDSCVLKAGLEADLSTTKLDHAKQCDQAINTHKLMTSHVQAFAVEFLSLLRKAPQI